mmetsp:Transcript_21046/g.38020  ORF Transcript_21046/g.38020 Transcript_21046/m.38020 type:complete len:94 (-) Transcript_21046:152-433(-)
MLPLPLIRNRLAALRLVLIQLLLPMLRMIVDWAQKRRDDGGCCCGIWSVVVCGMSVLGNADDIADDDANVLRKALVAKARSDIMASVYYTDGY